MIHRILKATVSKQQHAKIVVQAPLPTSSPSSNILAHPNLTSTFTSTKRKGHPGKASPKKKLKVTELLQSLDSNDARVIESLPAPLLNELNAILSLHGPGFIRPAFLPTNFANLPDDIILRIGDYSNCFDVIHLTHVNKKNLYHLFKRLFYQTDSTRLQNSGKWFKRS